MPAVSVIITSYNRANLLGDAIESIQNQSFTDWELVVVDDGSTDGAELIAKNYAGKDKRISLIVQDNGGLSVARNTGVENARGDLVAFLDDDDMSHPQRLERQVAVLQNNPDIAACVCNLSHIGMNRALAPAKKNPWLWQGHGLCIRRSVYITLGGYRKFFRLVEDVDFFLRFNERFQYEAIDDILYFYRKPIGIGNNLTTSPPLKFFHFINAAMYSAYCRQQGMDDPIDIEDDCSHVEKFIHCLPDLPLEMRILLMRKIRNSGRILMKHKDAGKENMLQVKDILNLLTCDKTKKQAMKHRRWLAFQSLRYGYLSNMSLFLRG